MVEAQLAVDHIDDGGGGARVPLPLLLVPLCGVDGERCQATVHLSPEKQERRDDDDRPGPSDRHTTRRAI
jgi:hypothetical protein